MKTEPLEDAILRFLYGKYTLTDGRIVGGQSYSQLVASLRCAGWRLAPYSDFIKEVTALGFEVGRGRGERCYRGGKRGLSVECDVIYIELDQRKDLR